MQANSGDSIHNYDESQILKIKIVLTFQGCKYSVRRFAKGLPMNIDKLHSLAAEDRIALKKHTVLRMHQRAILSDEVKTALFNCEILEDYPQDYPLPSGLVLGYTNKKRPIHLVVALDEESRMIWVITVYEPDEKEWIDNYRIRKGDGV